MGALGRDVADREADADLADDPVGTVAQRHLRARGQAERAALDFDFRPPAQRFGGIGAHRLAEEVRVGVGQPQPLAVGNHHEEGAGALAYPFRAGLYDVVGVLAGRGVGDRRVGRDRPRDGECPLAVLVGEFLVQQPVHEQEADADHEHDHADLQREDLPREPDPGW